MALVERAAVMRGLADELRPVGPVYQRVGELLAHIVGAHGAALERLVDLAAVRSVVEADEDLAEVLWVHRPAPLSDDAIDRYGNQIESLLTAIEQSATPPLAELAARLAGETTDLYGEALARAFRLLHDCGDRDAIRGALADDLIASLLVVHGLHPNSIDDRVRAGLADLAETSTDHGGAVELVEIDDQAVVRVRITGGSDIHRWRTRLAVEKTIERVAPDHGGIDVIGARNEPPPVALTTFISVDSIRRTAPARTPRRWIDVPELASLPEEAVDRVVADSVALIACNVGGDLYVAVDPFEQANGDGGAALRTGVRLVAVTPPTVETTDGRRLVFDAPLPVQRTDDGVEVMVP